MQKLKTFQLIRINPSGGVAIPIHLKSGGFQLVRINPSGGVTRRNSRITTRVSN
jgi:hypothetical protein